MRESPPAQFWLAGHEWRRGRAAGLHLVADRLNELVGKPAPPMGEDLAPRIQDDRAPSDGGGDLTGDPVETASLEDDPLESLVHRDPAREHVVLLVHETAEGGLRDRDERSLVGDLE